MSLKIPQEFPRRTSETELDDIIEECAWGMHHRTKDKIIPDHDLLLPHALQVAHNELSIRSQEKFAKESRRLSKYTIALAIATSILAAATLFFAMNDSAFDRSWKDQQVKLFEKQNLLLQDRNFFLEELVKEKVNSDTLDSKKGSPTPRKPS